MLDETYVVAEPDADSELLLFTDDPKSMRSIAWTRRYKNARVFCFQSGHDHNAYENPNFRLVVSRGIQWRPAGYSRSPQHEKYHVSHANINLAKKTPLP